MRRAGETIDGMLILCAIALVAVLVWLGAGDSTAHVAASSVSTADATTASTVPLTATSTVAPAAGAPAAEQTDITVEKDVLYRSVDGVELGADMYLPPAGAANGATVVLVHGGGWIGGDKEGFAPEAEALAQSGYVAASIDYRLAPEHQYPAPLDDVRAALDWLAMPETAQRYGVDPARVGMLGASAGGQLATMVGLTDSRVASVVSWSGIYDLTTFDMDDKLLGCVPKECTDRALEASPISHIGPDGAPILLVGFSDDPIVPVADTRAFDTALSGVGADHGILVVGGSGHATALRSEALDASWSYFAEHLGVATS